jgi:hypothetical protein
VEKCVCNVRARVLGTPGRARDQEEDVTEQKQELAHRRRAWRHGEALMAAVRCGERGGKTTQGQEGGGEAGEQRVGLSEAGGGVGVAATAIRGEARQGVASARSGKAAVERGRAHGRAQSGAEAAEAAHMAGTAAAARGRGK